MSSASRRSLWNFWSPLRPRPVRRKVVARTRPQLEALEERSLLSVQAVSLAAPGMMDDGGGASSALFGFYPRGRRLSDDGRFALFNSTAFNMALLSTNASSVYLFDRAAGVNTRIEYATSNASMSSDGRWITFDGPITPIPGITDLNADRDVYLYDRVLEVTTLVSHTGASATTTANLASYAPLISSDGRWIAFLSNATNVVAGQTGSGTNIFLYDRITNTSALVSHSSASATAGVGGSGTFLLSPDGRHVAYISTSTTLVAGQIDSVNTFDVFLYDRDTAVNTLVSRTSASATTTGNGRSAATALSADGRYVAYYSLATNLVAGVTDTNTADDVFLYDRDTGTNTLVSRTSTSATTAGGGFYPASSADGRYVAFVSSATNLVSGQSDGNAGNDVFLYDRVAGTTALVSHVSTSLTMTSFQAAIPTTEIALSADGRYVTFDSSAGDLMTGQVDPTGNRNVFLYDRVTGANTLVSHTAASLVTAANLTTERGVFSGDGRYLVYQGDATNVATGANDFGTTIDLFLYDRTTGTNVLVSHSEATLPCVTGGLTSNAATVSADGRYVAFNSNSANLVAGQTEQNTSSDVFLHDRVTRTMALVSHAAGSATTTGNQSASGIPSVSADGRYVAYYSAATNLVAGQTDTNGATDVFLYDRDTAVNTLVSRTGASATATGNNASSNPVISGDGRYVVYHSTATNLVAGQSDTNGNFDVFLYDRVTGVNTLVSRTSASAVTAGNNFSVNPVLSSDGRYVAFVSSATNLVAGLTDTNAANDVFLFDRVTGTTTLVSRTSASATTTGNSASIQPAVSDDGAYVAFLSQATNLVTGQTDNANTYDAFQYGRVAGTTTLVSHISTSATTTANSAGRPVVSADGRYVAFDSSATNLVTGQIDTNAQTDVFLFDRMTAVTTLVSHISTSATTTPSGTTPWSSSPRINADGRYVVFVSMASNLVTGQIDSGSTTDVFLFDRTTGTNQLASPTRNSTIQAAGNADLPSLSADGQYVAFQSTASNLVERDYQAFSDVFLFSPGQTRLFSWTGVGGDANWSTPANWQGGVAPTPGAILIFPTGAARLANTNDFVGATFDSIRFSSSSSGYTLSGNALTLNAGVSSGGLSSGANTIALDLTLAFNQSFGVSGAGNHLTLSGVVNGSAAFTKHGGGQLTVANSMTIGAAALGSGTLHISGMLSAALLTNYGGVLSFAAGGILSASSKYVQAAGSTALGGGIVVAPATYLIRGNFSGAGVVVGNLENAAVLTVGGTNAAGFLFVVGGGNYTQHASAMLNVEVGGLGLGTEYDFLYVEGTATFGGTLNVSLINGYVPVANDLFISVFAGARSGEFATVNGLLISASRAFFPYYFDNGLVLFTYDF